MDELKEWLYQELILLNEMVQDKMTTQNKKRLTGIRDTALNIIIKIDDIKRKIIIKG